MLHSFLILNYLFIFLCCLWAPLNDWVPWACCYMISGGIKYIAGICFPPLSGLDDTADKYSSSKVEEPRQQNKYVLHFIILIASSCLVGVEWRNSRLLLSDSDCFVFGQYGFCAWDLWLHTYVENNIMYDACMCSKYIFYSHMSLLGEGFIFGSNKIQFGNQTCQEIVVLPNLNIII